MDSEAWRALVFEDLARVAPAFEDDPRLTLPPIAGMALPGWPVGLERRLIALGLPRFDPTPLPPPSAAAAGFHYEDHGSSEHLLHRPPSELAAWRLWRLLDEEALTPVTLCDLSRLLGGFARIRKRPAATTRSISDHVFRFAPAAELPARIRCYSTGSATRHHRFHRSFTPPEFGLRRSSSTRFPTAMVADSSVPTPDAGTYVAGLIHNHPDALGDDNVDLVQRYPSTRDWEALERLQATYLPTNPGYDQSIWILDARGVVREFKLSDRAGLDALDDSQRRAGVGLEGRERTASCG